MIIIHYENEVGCEICVGRILRGFRIAARLGLSLSRETEDAIWTFSSLVKGLDKVLKLEFYDDGMLPEFGIRKILSSFSFTGMLVLLFVVHGLCRNAAL